MSKYADDITCLLKKSTILPITTIRLILQHKFKNKKFEMQRNIFMTVIKQKKKNKIFSIIFINNIIGTSSDFNMKT